MKILIAGASGAIGRQLVPRLTAAGHDVVGTTRTAAKQHDLRHLGATPVLLDALDRDQVHRVVDDVRPDVIVHELTAMPSMLDMRHIDRELAATNRLRTEATDHLLAAGRAAGTRRFVAQSFTSWPYARTGGPIKTEADPLDPSPVDALRTAFDAIVHLERAVVGAPAMEGVVLRYGGFYGPGTSLDVGSPQVELVRARKFPIVGDGAGVWSFVHVGDAADATVAAVSKGRGIYNIVDDDPAPVSEWLPTLAELVGAKAPRHVPRWVGKLLAGEAAAVMLTEMRGASNAKAKRELGWAPAHPSWRQGFVETLAASRATSERTRGAVA